MKIKIVMLLVCFSLLAACTSNGAVNTDTAWLETAKLDAHETPEELYQAALQEDTLQIYANTARLLDVKKSFEAHYPGLVVDFVDTRDYEIVRILKENDATGAFSCDLVVFTDNNGMISRELVPQGILHKYVPWDIADKITPPHNENTLMFLGESVVVCYNNETYDSPPIHNLWELTEEKHVGALYISNPAKSSPNYAFINTIIQNSDAMAAAYKNLYGKDLDIPSGSNAGQEFIRMLMKNQAVITNSSDEVAQAVGAPGQSNPPMGIMVSSKVRHNDIGYHLAPIYHLEPFAGVYAPNSIMMVTGAKNVNAAKLFIRWLLGESDGTGEGLKPYLQKGTWSVRSDIKSEEPVQLSEINVLTLDTEYIYNNRASFDKFWLSMLEENSAEK